ncbi:MAG: hypothetical protein ACI9VM_000642, partial [Candidatus Azotimanducaceae bacterium]
EMGTVEMGTVTIVLRKVWCSKTQNYPNGWLCFKEWNTLYQVRISLIEMECANFLKIVDTW